MSLSSYAFPDTVSYRSSEVRRGLKAKAKAFMNRLARRQPIPFESAPVEQQPEIAVPTSNYVGKVKIYQEPPPYAQACANEMNEGFEALQNLDPITYCRRASRIREMVAKDAALKFRCRLAAPYLNPELKNVLAGVL